MQLLPRKETVALRGHKIADAVQIPLIVDNAIEGLTKSKEVEATLASLGVIADITRVRDSRNVRAGKGKHRGRKMKQAIGPLIVVVNDKQLVNAASNVPGVQVTTVANLNTEMLAPGTHPGRLTLWSNGAIETLGKLYSKGESS